MGPNSIGYIDSNTNSLWRILKLYHGIPFAQTYGSGVVAPELSHVGFTCETTQQWWAVKVTWIMKPQTHICICKEYIYIRLYISFLYALTHRKSWHHLHPGREGLARRKRQTQWLRSRRAHCGRMRVRWWYPSSSRQLSLWMFATVKHVSYILSVQGCSE